MSKAIKILVSLAAAITALAGALCLIAVFWDTLMGLLPDGKVKSKLPGSKEELISKMPWKRSEIEAEFADYEEF